MFYKTIIQGRLDFGTEKSYDKVTKMFNYRLETYYNNAFIFNPEEIFNEEELNIVIPRFVGNVLEKSFKNTTDLLSYCSQFAVSGSIRAWLINEGQVLHFCLIEPESDKIAVQSYLKGKSMVKQTGQEQQALDELTKAIQKYDKHAMAYERRAKTNLILERYADAVRDYTKSIKIDPSMPSAYLGRARVYVKKEEFDLALPDTDQAVKKSVALESIHWKARRMKAWCHIKLKEFPKATFELKLFCNRQFKEDDINIQWKRWGWFYYGVSLMETENWPEAMMAFDKAADLPEKKDGVNRAEIIRNRGIAKQKAGKSGYIKDIKEAANLGDSKAQTLLVEMA
jgi:hypothetical protein